MIERLKEFLTIKRGVRWRNYFRDVTLAETFAKYLIEDYPAFNKENPLGFWDKIERLLDSKSYDELRLVQYLASGHPRTSKWFHGVAWDNLVEDLHIDFKHFLHERL